jgi:hypothetical protein
MHRDFSIASHICLSSQLFNILTHVTAINKFWTWYSVNEQVKPDAFPRAATDNQDEVESAPETLDGFWNEMKF